LLCCDVVILKVISYTCTNYFKVYELTYVQIHCVGLYAYAFVHAPRTMCATRPATITIISSLIGKPAVKADHQRRYHDSHWLSHNITIQKKPTIRGLLKWAKMKVKLVTGIYHMRKKVIFGAQKCLPCVDQVWFESVHISLSRTQNWDPSGNQCSLWSNRSANKTRWTESVGELLYMILNKNLAIANRSRVRCIHTMSRASMITSWP